MSSQLFATDSCPQCGAKWNARAAVCWKCGQRRDGVTADRTLVTSPYLGNANPQASIRSSGAFGIASLLLVTSLIAVCLALFVAAPGLGIVLSILSIIPFIRTMAVVGRKKKSGAVVDPFRKILLFIGSLWTTLVVVVVVLATAWFTFFFTCMSTEQMARANSLGNNDYIICFSVLVTLVVSGLLIWAFSFWIRARWRRDTNISDRKK